jgi:hypothetical protein
MAYVTITSQVQSKVEEKPNIATLPKLRLTTCCRSSVRISRRSKSVPVHFGSSIVRRKGLNEEITKLE